MTDLVDLRVQLSQLDRAEVDDANGNGPRGDVTAGSVLTDGHPVGGGVEDRQGNGELWVGEVDRRDVAVVERGRVEGLAVGGEPALVTQEADRQARLQRRVPAVLVHVVHVDHARVRDRVTGHSHEQAALRIEVQRLV